MIRTLTFCDLNKLRIRFVVPFIVSSQAYRCCSLNVKKNNTTVGPGKGGKASLEVSRFYVKSPQYYMVH